MEKENVSELFTKSEFSEVSKLTKKMELQIEKLHEKNPVMALIFLSKLQQYAKGYTDTVLKNNNIPQDLWDSITAMVGEWELEEFMKYAEPYQILSNLPNLQVEGWAFTPGNATAHYFTFDRRSLCGQYVWLDNEESIEKEDGIESSDDCPVCRELLKEMAIVA